MDHTGLKSTVVTPADVVADNGANTLLADLGYEAELKRNRSTLQVAFMSFVLASIPWGLSTTVTYPITGGGPVNIIWGWVAVSLIILCVAASLGEITSVYPTAGGTLTTLVRERSTCNISQHHCIVVVSPDLDR